MDNGASSYRRFLDGDEQSFVEIIKDYKDGLIFYLNGFVCDLHIAEDLAEDVFVKIVTKKPRFSGKASFKTWLYAIGRNIALDYLRRRTRKNEVSITEAFDVSDEAQSIEEEFFKDEQKIILHRALYKLKSEYRQILWLIYFEDFSCKDASFVMKKSVHSIETLVYRARQALKAELIKEDFDYENL